MSDSISPGYSNASPAHRRRDPYAPRYCSVCADELLRVPYRTLSRLTLETDFLGRVNWGALQRDTTEDILTCSPGCWAEIENVPVRELFVSPA